MLIEKITYTDYLKSVLWKRFRSWAIEFYGRRCEFCGSENGLSVHHWTYKRLGRERIDDVGVYCRECHKLIHDLQKQQSTYDGLIMKWMDKEQIVRPYSWRVADRISCRIDRMLEKREMVIWIKERFKKAENC